MQLDWLAEHEPMICILYEVGEFLVMKEFCKAYLSAKYEEWCWGF